MKYIAVFELDGDKQLEKLDETVIKVQPFEEESIKCTIKPLIRETFINKNGESVYITQGHIDAMIEYEQKVMLKGYADDLIKGLKAVANEEATKYFRMEKNHTDVHIKADALKNKKPNGEWGFRYANNADGCEFYCTVCDYSMETKFRTNYCPNCGADMRGEKK